MLWTNLRAPLAVLTGLASMAVVLPAGAAAPQTRYEMRMAADASRVSYHEWTSLLGFAKGTFEGVRPTGAGALTIAKPIGKLTYKDPFGGGARRSTRASGATAWEYGRWTSPPQSIGFGASQLVASWTADTPAGTWLQVEMRGRTDKGTTTKWYVMSRWAAGDTDIHRTSVPKQGDDDGTVDIDTFTAKNGQTLRSYELRVTLFRKPARSAAESGRSPVLRSVGAMASWLPKRDSVGVSPSGGAWGTELKVPAKSQMAHRGHYPQWGGGGQAWCSPTSTAMVIEYWKRGPRKKDMSWVDAADRNPEVDYAARGTYDYNYKGTGNWPYNPAYAGRFGLNGFVTRLRSLTELERFIKAGIPVITSQSFKAAELPGAAYSTEGHLMVVVGFTGKGDPIVNDPAARSNGAVRRVYPRAGFENVWLRSSSSGGIVYVIYPPGHALPPNIPGLDKNW